MYNGGCNDTGCFGIKIRTDAAKLTNVRIARFRECRDLVRECEMFIKNEAKVTSRGKGSEAIKNHAVDLRRLVVSGAAGRWGESIMSVCLCRDM